MSCNKSLVLYPLFLPRLCLCRSRFLLLLHSFFLFPFLSFTFVLLFSCSLCVILPHTPLGHCSASLISMHALCVCLCLALFLSHTQNISSLSFPYSFAILRLLLSSSSAHPWTISLRLTLYNIMLSTTLYFTTHGCSRSICIFHDSSELLFRTVY